MLANRDLVAFLCTTDPERAIGFFRDLLGLELVEANPFACVFDANGTTLRVSVVSELSPRPFTVLGWTVPDLTAAAADLAERGIEPVRFDGMDQDERGIWSTPGGDLVAWFCDPDGNLLSLTQPAG